MLNRIAHRQLLGAFSRLSRGNSFVPAATMRTAREENRTNFIGLAAFAAAATVGSAAALCDEKPVFTETVLGETTNFPNGRSIEFKVLVTNVNGKFHVTGSSCPHYSAPLANGVTTPTHLTCPWHDAEFSLTTGECVNGPSMDPIAVYSCEVKDGKLVASLPPTDSPLHRPLARRDPNNNQTFVICGGGPAAICAAETLRVEGFTGRVVVLGREKYLAYDRPVLSKNAAPEIDKILLRTQEEVDAMDVEFITGANVTSLKPDEKVVEYAKNGETVSISYDKVLIATGTQPRKVFAPGHDASNIFACRTPEDVTGIHARLAEVKKTNPEPLVVIVGTSFIGMELAATLQKEGCLVCVVGRERVPFERVLGARVGAAIQAFFEARGVIFCNSASVQQFRTDEKGALCVSVDLDNNLALPADLVVAGAGVIPTAGSFLQAPAQLAMDGSVLVDPTFECTTAPGVFAAGDVASFPSVFHGGKHTRIEHWAVAMEQGRVAARNMLGRHAVYQKVPFFWTSFYGRMLRCAGTPRGHDDVVVEGDLKTLRFAAWYFKEDKVIALATVAKDPAAVAFAELLALGLAPTAEEVRSGSVKAADLEARLQQYTGGFPATLKTANPPTLPKKEEQQQ